MITIQVEKYNDCIAEIDALLPLHYDEIALDKDSIPLDKDHAVYQRLADSGELHIVTVRCNGLVVGYHASFVHPHFHYKSTLIANTDVYFLLKEHRNSRIGMQLFQEVERSLKARGVHKMFTGTKCHQDHSAMFERMGWHKTEILYTKVIGE